jgi:hypothetical protein
MSLSGGIVYPAFTAGLMSSVAGSLRAQLVGAGYVPSAEHATVDDLADLIGDAVPVTAVLPATAEGLDIEPITFAVPADVTVTGVAFYLDGSSTLVAFVDRRADTVPLSVATAGPVGLTLTFPSRLIRL